MLILVGHHYTVLFIQYYLINKCLFISLFIYQSSLKSVLSILTNKCGWPSNPNSRPKSKLKIELSVSFYPSSGSIKDYRFHICHNQFKNDVFPKSRSICQHFHSCQLSNVNLIDTASNFRWNDLNLPQSLNFSFRSSNSCWAYSYNSISSEFIARILNWMW